MMDNMRGQMRPTEEEIMELMKTPEGKLIIEQIMAAENSGEAVGGGNVTPPNGLYPGPMGDESAEDYTSWPPRSEFDVQSLETGAVDPMAPGSLEKRRMIEELLRAQGGDQMNIR